MWACRARPLPIWRKWIYLPVKDICKIFVRYLWDICVADMWARRARPLPMRDPSVPSLPPPLILDVLLLTACQHQWYFPALPHNLHLMSNESWREESTLAFKGGDTWKGLFDKWPLKSLLNTVFKTQYSVSQYNNPSLPKSHSLCQKGSVWQMATQVTAQYGLQDSILSISVQQSLALYQRVTHSVQKSLYDAQFTTQYGLQETIFSVTNL